MINKKLKCHIAVISHKRPENVKKILEAIEKTPKEVTFYVNDGERMDYIRAGAVNVVEAGTDICMARNAAIDDAGSYPSIQTSDDLKRIKKIHMMGGKRQTFAISFDEVIFELMGIMRRSKFNYGGTAVTSNQLNYTGKDISTDKLIVCDLICVMNGTRFDPKMALKEDYDLTIDQLLRYGGVIRLDNILCEFPHRENKGGANTYRNSKSEAEATKKLFDKWGNLIKPHATREGQISLNYKLIREARQQMIAASKRK